MDNDERANLAWEMRLRNPPASWASISRAFGLKDYDGAAHRAFADACEQRGLSRMVWLWEDRKVSESALLRIWTEGPGGDPEEIHKALAQWRTLDDLRQNSTLCPHCNGMGRIKH